MCFLRVTINSSTDIIKRYATEQARTLVEKSDSIKNLEHSLTKGMLRELFISDALQPFLSSQFSIGSGIIVNQMGDQSPQVDVIILDNHILPPFIGKQYLGIYPVECVVSTIEVKSDLAKDDLLDAEKNARVLKEIIFNGKRTLTPTVLTSPFCGVFGFHGTGIPEISQEEEGKNWLGANVRALNAICSVKKHCWVNKSFTNTPHWSIEDKTDTFEEIKRFLAIVVDYSRYLSASIESNLRSGPQDWISAYIREKNPKNE